MAEMASSIAFVLSWLLAYRYLIIFPLVIFEGPIVMLVCGFLIRLGGFDFWPTYLLLILGDLIGDIGWYAAGRYGARRFMERFGKLFGIGMREIEHFENLFNTHDTKILLISKLTMGFGFAFATLAGAGAAHVPFRKYFMINLVGGVVWTGILITIGYFFGNLYYSISENMRIGFVTTASIIAVSALYFFARYARARIKELN